MMEEELVAGGKSYARIFVARSTSYNRFCRKRYKVEVSQLELRLVFVRVCARVYAGVCAIMVQRRHTSSAQL